jgi:hypothetical protein
MNRRRLQGKQAGPIVASKMNQIAILSDSLDTAGIIGRELAGMFEAQPVLRRDLARTKPAHAVVVDVDLSDSSYFSDLRALADAPAEARQSDIRRRERSEAIPGSCLVTSYMPFAAPRLLIVGCKNIV